MGIEKTSWDERRNVEATGVQISLVSGGSVWIRLAGTHGGTRSDAPVPAAHRQSGWWAATGETTLPQRGCPADPCTSGTESRDVAGLPGWTKAGASLANFNLIKQSVSRPHPLSCFFSFSTSTQTLVPRSALRDAGTGRGWFPLLTHTHAPPGDDHGGKVIVALCIVMRAWPTTGGGRGADGVVPGGPSKR